MATARICDETTDGFTVEKGTGIIGCVLACRILCAVTGIDAGMNAVVIAGVFTKMPDEDDC